MKIYILLLLSVVETFSTKSVNFLKPGTRIYNGTLAKPEEFPWHATIVTPIDNLGSTFNCGGALISTKHVLTAAHCFKHAHHGNVSLGSTKFMKGTKVFFEKVSIHAKFKLCSMENDIAIIHLSKEVQPNGKTISIIELDDVKVEEEEELEIAGFGLTSDILVIPEDLYKTKLISKPINDCSFTNVHATPAHLCCKGVTKLEKICFGDSGGALVRIKDGIAKHVGVASYSNTYCGPYGKSGFMRTESYIDWINSHRDPY